MPNKSTTSLGTVLVMLFAACLGQASALAPAVAPESSPEAILPDAPSAVVRSQPPASFQLQVVFESGFPPSSAAKVDERFHRFLETSFSSSATRGNLLDAGQAQIQKAWPGYGKGFRGFEKRYFAITADHAAGNFFGAFLFPTLLHQNPRSPRLGPGSSLWRRLGYAASRAALTRDDSGNTSFNTSLLLSTVASSAVKNFYYPRDQRGVSTTVSAVERSLLGNVQGNLSREFLPDIQHFLWKHAPERWQRFTQRLPFHTVR
ncbi:MAG TPA: hypothetical protein VEF05_11570 [Terriglobales bacterium]|nr:hypothetical protein [Terriglobales bacterium]